jgi:hypothetical protein
MSAFAAVLILLCAATAAAAKRRAAWKSCPARSTSTFRCMPRSQGVAPPRGETVPQVCGCIPRCPASSPVLLAFEAEGRWPDGSRKGRFSCGTAGIPSAPPPPTQPFGTGPAGR